MSNILTDNNIINNVKNSEIASKIRGNETIQGLKGVGIGSLAIGFLGDIANVTGAATAFSTSQDQGDNVSISLAKAGANFAIGEVFYGAMSSNFGLGSIGTMAGYHLVSTGAQMWLNQKQQDARDLSAGTESVKRLGSGHFDMTEKGYTMRQRSLNAIRSNGANLNSAFGNEARNYYLGL